jgi:hypothetical protein
VNVLQYIYVIATVIVAIIGSVWKLQSFIQSKHDLVMSETNKLKVCLAQLTQRVDKIEQNINGKSSVIK